MDLREKVFTYDMKKRGEEVRALFKEYDKLLRDCISETEKNKTAKKKKVKMIRFKQKGFQLTIKNSGKSGIAKKELNDFVYELISDYSVAVLFAHEYFELYQRTYNELFKANPSKYNLKRMAEERIFYSCNIVSRGLPIEIQGTTIHPIDDKGKKKKLIKIIKEIVEVEGDDYYKLYHEEESKEDLLNNLYLKYLKWRVNSKK